MTWGFRQSPVSGICSERERARVVCPSRSRRGPFANSGAANLAVRFATSRRPRSVLRFDEDCWRAYIQLALRAGTGRQDDGGSSECRGCGLALRHCVGLRLRRRRRNLRRREVEGRKHVECERLRAGAPPPRASAPRIATLWSASGQGCGQHRAASRRASGLSRSNRLSPSDRSPRCRVGRRRRPPSSKAQIRGARGAKACAAAPRLRARAPRRTTLALVNSRVSTHRVPRDIVASLPCITTRVSPLA